MSAGGVRGEEREVTHRERSSVDSNTAEMARENNTNTIRVGQICYVRTFVETKHCSHNKELRTQHTHTHRHVKTRCLLTVWQKGAQVAHSSAGKMACSQVQIGYSVMHCVHVRVRAYMQYHLQCNAACMSIFKRMNVLTVVKINGSLRRGLGS